MPLNRVLMKLQDHLKVIKENSLYALATKPEAGLHYGNKTPACVRDVHVGQTVPLKLQRLIMHNYKTDMTTSFPIRFIGLSLTYCPIEEHRLTFLLPQCFCCVASLISAESLVALDSNALGDKVQRVHHTQKK